MPIKIVVCCDNIIHCMNYDIDNFIYLLFIYIDISINQFYTITHLDIYTFADINSLKDIYIII